MIVVTTNDIPNKKTLEVKGIAHGIVVRTPTWKQGFLGGIKKFIGGNNQAYADMANHSREDAYQNMIKHAESLGANAIVAFRYDTSSMDGNGEAISEVFCYGTAVIVE